MASFAMRCLIPPRSPFYPKGTKNVATRIQKHSRKAASILHRVSVAKVDARQEGTGRGLTDLLHPFYNQQQPLLMRGAVSSAPGIEKWKHWSYFRDSLPQDAVCHVEVGGNYADTNSRAEIRLGDYLAYLEFFHEKHGTTASSYPPMEELVYMAQNDVFQELVDDFQIPEACTSLGHGKLYSTMIWIGPYGCRSPMHFDPLDNLLMQFVGSKHVMLYPPDAPVYAGHDGNQNNTSPINPEEPPDLTRYPLLSELEPAQECLIKPADVLFIPRKWFHHVRTVETSVSINAWWR